MYFIYKVKFWKEDSQKEDIEQGIVYGENYGNALEKLYDDYGQDNIFKVSLAFTTEFSSLSLSEETIEAIKGDTNI